MAPPRRRNPASGKPAGGGARRGRPTVYSDKVFAMMKDYARRLGFSDTAAAEGVGVSSSTISRWKKECPEIAHELQTARQECRVHHLERMMQFAEGDDNRGLRATMWLLERLYPGDYAPRMSERFAYRNFEDRQREREEEALQKEREAEAKAAARGRSAGEISRGAGRLRGRDRATRGRRRARGRRATRRPGRRRRSGKMPHPPLKSDSHNSRNSGEAEPRGDSDAHAHPSQQAAEVQGVARGHVRRCISPLRAIPIIPEIRARRSRRRTRSRRCPRSRLQPPQGGSRLPQSKEWPAATLRRCISPLKAIPIIPEIHRLPSCRRRRTPAAP